MELQYCPVCYFLNGYHHYECEFYKGPPERQPKTKKKNMIGSAAINSSIAAKYKDQPTKSDISILWERAPAYATIDIKHNTGDQRDPYNEWVVTLKWTE